MLTPFLIGAAKVAGVGVAVVAAVAAVREVRNRVYASNKLRPLMSDIGPGKPCAITEIGSLVGDAVSPWVNGQLDRQLPVIHGVGSAAILVLSPYAFAVYGGMACILMLSGCAWDTAVAHRLGQQLEVQFAAEAKAIDQLEATYEDLPPLPADELATQPPALKSEPEPVVIQLRPKTVPLAELKFATTTK